MPRRPHQLPPTPPNDAEIDTEPEREYRVVDRRRPDRTWIPSYIVEDFGPQLGVNGLAVYLVLCHHADRHTRNCYPSVNLIAAEAGTSRSTVERAIRLLEALNLVQREPRYNRFGRRSNFYILTDPPSAPGAEVVVNNRTEPPVTPTAPPCPIDGGAPSIGGRPPVTQTARSGPDPGNQDPGNGSARPPDSAPQLNPEVDSVVEAWFATLVCPSGAIRRTQKDEITAEVAELLRRGYSAEELRGSILDPERERTEYPRIWRARVCRRPPARRRSPAVQAAADRARRQAEAEETARAGREGLKQMGVQTLSEALELRRRQAGGA